MEKGLRILLLCNAFKGALSSSQAADILEQSIQEHAGAPVQIKALPLCDGGDGTMEILAKHYKASIQEMEALDALGRACRTGYAFLQQERLAIMDLASVVGIAALQGSELQPHKASSYGLGQVLQQALEKGAQRVMMGLGGSASMDGGMGLLAALGYTFFDAEGKKRTFQAGISDIPSFMQGIHRVDPPEKKEALHSLQSLIVLQDVPHLLTGKEGAVHVFGPQKGMKPNEEVVFEEALRHFARVMGQEQLLHHKGIGAAGGVSLALSLLPGFEPVSGPDFILQLLKVREELEQADVAITTEGRLDVQSEHGKLAAAVGRLSADAGIPVICFTGENRSSQRDAWRIWEINKFGLPLEDNLRHCGLHLREAAGKWAATLPDVLPARK
jgi:glycerate kinase